MVVPTVGAVVLVPFPFSNLSQAKLRPAVVLADVGRGDWILCQITSNPYGDPHSVSITSDGFASGSLRVVSYARTGKLFTASQDLMLSKVATLNHSQFITIVEMVVNILAIALLNSLNERDRPVVNHGVFGRYSCYRKKYGVAVGYLVVPPRGVKPRFQETRALTKWSHGFPN